MNDSVRQAPDVNAGLRAMALNRSADELGIPVPREGRGIWGVFADMSFPNGSATVVAFADGSASIYWGKGGGVIGGGDHKKVSDSAKSLVNVMEPCSGGMNATGVHDLPKAGFVRIYAHSRSGLLSTAELPANELAAGGHPLSGCFAAVDELITQLRLISDDAV